MRIDKYLWAVRYYKTRNQAAEACKKGHIMLNSIKAKPAKEAFSCFYANGHCLFSCFFLLVSAWQQLFISFFCIPPQNPFSKNDILTLSGQLLFFLVEGVIKK